MSPGIGMTVHDIFRCINQGLSAERSMLMVVGVLGDRAGLKRRVGHSPRCRGQRPSLDGQIQNAVCRETVRRYHSTPNQRGGFQGNPEPSGVVAVANTQIIGRPVVTLTKNDLDRLAVQACGKLDVFTVPIPIREQP
jgi:hypothetical protein